MPTPDVSVCIINCGPNRHLDRAITSAFDQQGVVVEVVVVGDAGGTDDAGGAADDAGVAAAVTPALDGIRVLRSAAAGEAAVMNAAFEATTGETVVFLDADDWLEPGILAEVHATMRATAAATVQFRARVVDDAGRDLGQVIPPRPGILPSGDLSGHVLEFRSYPWPPSSAHAYRRAALAQLLPIPEDRYADGHSVAWLAELLPLLGEIASLDSIGLAHRTAARTSVAGVDAGWLQHKIRLTMASHADLVLLCRRQGLPIPPTHDSPLDGVYLGYRLASLVLDERHHPVPADTRTRLARRGIRGVIRNPYLGLRQTLLRSWWFLRAGYLPPRLARAAVAAWVPDGPKAR